MEQHWLLDIKETARLLGVSQVTVRRLIATGKLEIVRIGKRTLVPRAEISRIAGGTEKWTPWRAIPGKATVSGG